MRILDTDIKRLGVMILPTCLRRPMLIGLVYYMLTPLYTLLGLLKDWRKETLHRVRYNGQTVNLELCLNDKLDPALRRIRITDSSMSSGRGYYVYRRGVNYNDMVLARGKMPCVILAGRASGGQICDFVVNVPRDVVDTKGQNYNKLGDPSKTMMTLLNRYKLPSKRYEIRNG